MLSALILGAPGELFRSNVVSDLKCNVERKAPLCDSGCSEALTPSNSPPLTPSLSRHLPSSPSPSPSPPSITLATFSFAFAAESRIQMLPLLLLCLSLFQARVCGVEAIMEHGWPRQCTQTSRTLMQSLASCSLINFVTFAVLHSLCPRSTIGGCAKSFRILL